MNKLKNLDISFKFYGIFLIINIQAYKILIYLKKNCKINDINIKKNCKND